jgi:hypothetical protein
MYPLFVIPTTVMLFFVYIKKTITWNPLKGCTRRLSSCCCKKSNRVQQKNKAKEMTEPPTAAEAAPIESIIIEEKADMEIQLSDRL